jgi:hypothetical protein
LERKKVKKSERFLKIAVFWNVFKLMFAAEKNGHLFWTRLGLAGYMRVIIIVLLPQKDPNSKLAAWGVLLLAKRYA